MKTIFTEEEVLSHCPSTEDIREEVLEFATEHALLNSRYIVTQRVGKQQYGYCTHCRKEFQTPFLYKHNRKELCPKCGSSCLVKASGRGRGNMVDEALFVQYYKSILDPKAIVAMAFLAVRDYRPNIFEVYTLVKPVAFYLFKAGEGSGCIVYNFYYTSIHGICCWGAKATKSIMSVYGMYSKMDDRYDHTKMATDVDKESIRKAVSDTPFAWSGWEKIAKDNDHDADCVKFFELAARYPSVEYLMKLGLDRIVKAKTYGNYTLEAVNWRGKSLQKVLRISPKDFSLLKKSSTPVEVDPLTLKIYQYAVQEQSPVTWESSAFLAKAFSSKVFGLREFHAELSGIHALGLKLKQVYTYLQKQMQRNDVQPRVVYSTWCDYIKDCKTLQLDLSQDAVLFPGNLYRAHQNTIKQVSYQENKELDAKITKRLKELNALSWQSDGLMIFPAACTGDLIAEGRSLHHCVGGYASRYASGGTNIFFIRKADNPEIPYYTLELGKKPEYTIWQVRGRHNCSATPEITAFLSEWTDKVVKERKELRIEIPVAI